MDIHSEYFAVVVKNILENIQNKNWKGKTQYYLTLFTISHHIYSEYFAVFVRNIMENIKKKLGRIRVNIISPFLQYPTIFIQHILHYL